MKITIPQIVKRPWGVEEWIANLDYCTKRLIIKKDEIIRCHSHKKKHETFYIDKGRILIKVGSKSRVLKKGEIVEIPTNTKHKVLALEDSIIIEASTHHEDSDSYFHSAVFLDRDGVINKDLGAEKYKKTREYNPMDKDIFLKSFSELRFETKALEGLRLLSEMDFKLIIVTNQTGIARGFMTEQQVQALHYKLLKLLSKSFGITIDEIYMCPHDKERGKGKYKIKCNCHKPRPGFLYQTKEKLDIDLSESFMIGDKKQDIATGYLVGCRTILLKTGWKGKCPEKDSFSSTIASDFTAGNLLEVAKLLKKTF